MTTQLHKITNWCAETQRMCEVTGEIIGRRQADLIKVHDCLFKTCPMRNQANCQINKTYEGVL